MPENGPLIDTPLLEKLERLAIQWQKSLPGTVGGHNTSRFAGAGQEFLDHRQFYDGDDLRAVNWRAYLRLEKLFLKMATRSKTFRRLSRAPRLLDNPQKFMQLAYSIIVIRSCPCGLAHRAG